MPSCPAKRAEQQRKRRQQQKKDPAAIEKKKAATEVRRKQVDRERKFLDYHRQKAGIIMKTPRRPSKRATAATPLTPGQQLVMSQAAKNEEGRRETEKKLFQLKEDDRKFNNTLITALTKMEEGRQRDMEAVERAATPGPRARNVQSFEEEDTDEEVEEASGYFSSWFGFKLPAVKTPMRPKSSEKEEVVMEQEDRNDKEEAGNLVDEEEVGGEFRFHCVI